MVAGGHFAAIQPEQTSRLWLIYTCRWRGTIPLSILDDKSHGRKETLSGG